MLYFTEFYKSFYTVMITIDKLINDLDILGNLEGFENIKRINNDFKKSKEDYAV